MHSETGEWFGVDSGNVLSEVIDGEVMIIDMRLGNYYSLSGVAVTIWNALTEPRRIEDIVEIVSRHHSDAPADVTDQVRRFVDELAAEQLVCRQVDGPAGQPPTLPPAAVPAPFRSPALEKYTDMQALLLVDPIHDVDVLGWPAKARES